MSCTDSRAPGSLLGLGAEHGAAGSSLGSWMEMLSWAVWESRTELQAELPAVTGGLSPLQPSSVPLSTGKSRLFCKQAMF